MNVVPWVADPRQSGAVRLRSLFTRFSCCRDFRHDGADILDRVVHCKHSLPHLLRRALHRADLPADVDRRICGLNR